MPQKIQSQSVMKQSKVKIPPTQKHLPLKEIRDDCVILTDNTLRAVILISSINFDLKNEEEQEATIAAYVRLLNSLEFPIQIVIQSRKMDIDEYLESLRKKEREQMNELLKKQTADYISWISELVELADIMTKRFYLVVPLDPLGNKPKGFFTRLEELLIPRTTIKLTQKKFKENKIELEKRVDFVMGSLASAGLRSVRLDTQSLIELYYNTYNPELVKNQELTDVSQVNVES